MNSPHHTAAACETALTVTVTVTTAAMDFKNLDTIFEFLNETE